MLPVRSPCRNVVVNESISILKCTGPGLKHAWYNAASPYTFKAKVTNCYCDKSVESECVMKNMSAYEIV